MEETRPSWGVGSGEGGIHSEQGRAAKVRGGKSPRSFVLRTYIIGGMGVKMLHIDWRVKVVPACPSGEHDYPDVGMCGGLSAWILILLQTLFVHLVVKQIVSRGGQLTKVVLWAASLGTMDPFPPFRPWDEHTVSKAFFPREWKHSIEFQGLPSSRANIVFPVQLEHLAILSDQAQDCLVSGWDTSPSSSLLGSLSILPKC